MNKIDLLDDAERRELRCAIPTPCSSPRRRENLDALRSRIADAIRQGLTAVELLVPFDAGERLLSFTRSLVTSSARIARTGCSFARATCLPRRSVLGSFGQRKVPEARSHDPRAEPGATRRSTGSLDALVPDQGDEGDDRATPTVGGVEELRFIKLSEKATLPTRAHDNDAGLDLYSAEAARIVPGPGRASGPVSRSRSRRVSPVWFCRDPDWR